MSAVGAMARLVRAERAVQIALREIDAAREELQQKPRPGPCADLRQELGIWVRAHRAQRGLSRDKLARQIGVSTGTLKNIERAQHVPTPDTLALLRRGLALPVDLRARLDVASHSRK